MPTKYNRNRTELEAKACKWWPENLVLLEAESSIIPTLVRTQDQFISILTLSDSHNPNSVFEVITAAHFAANLFLKHLMVLTDFGSEPLQRINRDFANYFPDNKLHYAVNGHETEYEFSALPARGALTNKKMHTDIEAILTSDPLNSFYKDLITLLLFGSNAVDDYISDIFSKCIVGNMMGETDELKDFIKQRYIFVSRITGGAQANGLGNAAQVYAEKYFQKKLGAECNTCKVITNKPKKIAPGCPAKIARRRSPKSDMRVKSSPLPYPVCSGSPGLQFPAKPD
jgi:hypothetical protein